MTIRWGIIGCGDVCEVKSGPGFQKAGGSELVAVMRRDADKAADYADRHSVPNWTTDADELINNAEVDAIYIATPVDTHVSYALRACEVGKPCYLEKPPARSAAELQRAIDAFEAAGLPLFVGFYRRALPRFVETKRIVNSGRLGRIVAVDYRHAVNRLPKYAGKDESQLEWRLHAEQSGGGLIMDLGSHTLDILDYMLGPITEVHGRAANVVSPHSVEDSVWMTGTIGERIPLTAAWHFAAADRDDRIRIVGTEGRIELTCFGNEPVQVFDADGNVEHLELPNPPHVHQPLIQTIVDELAGNGSCPSTGRTALRTMHVLDAVLSDYYGGRADDFWTRPETWPGRRG